MDASTTEATTNCVTSVVASLPWRTFRKPSIIQRRFGYSSGNCEMTSIALKIAIQNSVMPMTVPLDSAPMVMPHETTTARQEPP